MEIQYLDNITKKIIFAPVMVWERILNFELGGTSESASRTGDCGTGGTGGTSETSGSASRTGRDVGQVREVYTKEVAKCVYKQLDKPTDVEETLKKLAEKMNNNQFTE